MTWKVIWKEGTFIRPQHFQQQERYITDDIVNKISGLNDKFWGLQGIKINQSELSIGTFALDFCNVTFQDGSSFFAPDQERLPLSIQIPDGVRDSIVYLTLPEKRKNTIEVGSSDEAASVFRYSPNYKEVVDVANAENPSEKILVGELKVDIRYEYDGDDDTAIPEGIIKLPIAKIEEVKGGKITLDPKFIPCCVNGSSSEVIMNFCTEFQSMITTRAEALAKRVSGTGGSGGVAEVTDFMLLQLLNRLEPVVDQLRKFESHPFDLYMAFLSFAGELSTFMKAAKRPISFPDYNHLFPTECFSEVMKDIFDSFSVVLEEIATAIQLSPPKNGIRAARVTNKSILETGYLVLAVKADVGEEILISQFPAQIKIGPGEKIFQLVQSSLPGIKLISLPQVPREIPYHAGFKYFELSKKDALWEELKQSKGIAFHVSGNFPGLELQLWSINRG